MKRPRHTAEIIIVSGVLTYLLGMYLSKALEPGDLLSMSREESLHWWLAMVVRDVGLSVTTFTLLAAGVRSLRQRNLRRRGVAMSFLGVGLSLTAIFMAASGYYVCSRSLDALFLPDPEVTQQLAEMRAQEQVDEERMRAWDRLDADSARARAMLEGMTGSTRAAILINAELLLAGLAMGLVLPMRRDVSGPQCDAMSDK